MSGEALESGSGTAGPPRLPTRRADSHKGDFGRVLVVGGSRGMTGAAGLAGAAALRAGAGLVTIATADACWQVVAGYEPSYMTAPLPSDGEGRIGGAAQSALGRLAAKADAAACGPGLGRSDELDRLVAWFYAECPAPLVVDADGLNALAAAGGPAGRPAGPRVLTPHPGECRRLCPDAPPARPAMERLADQRARQWDVVIVLKGHGTWITDGRRSARNATGNPGMATGGAGDVLTGVIAALLGQGMEPFDAAWLGAAAHGLAGDLAARQLGQTGMIASDLLRFLPQAFVQLETPS